MYIADEIFIRYRKFGYEDSVGVDNKENEGKRI